MRGPGKGFYLQNIVLLLVTKDHALPPFLGSQGQKEEGLFKGPLQVPSHEDFTKRLSSSHQIRKDQKCGSSWQLKNRRQALAERLGRDTAQRHSWGQPVGNLSQLHMLLPLTQGTNSVPGPGRSGKCVKCVLAHSS